MRSLAFIGLTLFALGCVWPQVFVFLGFMALAALYCALPFLVIAGLVQLIRAAYSPTR